MTIDIHPRSTTRGRPRTTGTFTCARCGRQSRKARTRWPDGRVCGTCFYQAMRTYGTCPGCGDHRLLPGRVDGEAVCGDCAGIVSDLRCQACGVEAEHYRRDICARCVLCEDLTTLLLDEAQDMAAMTKLIEVLCAAERSESILTWLRPAAVRDLLGRVATGDLPLTHDAFDDEPASRRIEHLRGLLVHHGLLPQRDHHLFLFGRWLDGKLDGISEPEIRRLVEQFARWHHLRRIRAMAQDGKATRGPTHSAKQEITETIKFLEWLHATHGRLLPDCSQTDVDSWLASGPTTRHSIRTFFIWAGKNRLCTSVVVRHRTAKTTRLLTQEQRLAWLRECLTGESESLPYRVAGVLLLLYAQPLVKISALRMDDIEVRPDTVLISFGGEPVPVPEPFTTILRAHLSHRPNLRTGNLGQSIWLFPSHRAGCHIDRDAVMSRLRRLGIDLLGARNAALRQLVTEAPAPVVGELLGYSHQVVERHAADAAAPYTRYVRGGSYAGRPTSAGDGVPMPPVRRGRRL